MLRPQFLPSFLLPFLAATIALAGCGPVMRTGDGTMAPTRSTLPPAPVPTTTITVVNQTGATICYLLASPTTDSSWGEDRLGRGTLAAGGELSFTVATSPSWDLRGLDCERRELMEYRNVPLPADGRFVVEDNGDHQSTGGSAAPDTQDTTDTPDTATAPTGPLYLYASDGSVFARIDGSYAYGSSGSQIARFDGDYVYDQSGAQAARFDGSYVYGANGSQLGRVDGSYVYDSSGAQLGRMDGQYAYDGSGSQRGRVDGGSITREAMYLFFFFGR